MMSEGADASRENVDHQKRKILPILRLKHERGAPDRRFARSLGIVARSPCDSGLGRRNANHVGQPRGARFSLAELA
jgi:hypothetical protein